MRKLARGGRARRRHARAVRAQWCNGRADGGSAIEIVLKEGRKRIVRRMCAEIGHPVRRLVRTRIGPLSDSKLTPGEHAGRSRRRRCGRCTPRRSSRPKPRPANLRPRESSWLCAARPPCDENTKDEVDIKTQPLVEAMLERNAIDARRHRQHHLHRDRRHHRRVPGDRRAQARSRRCPAALRAGARDRARDAVHDPSADALLRRAAAGRAAPRVPRRCALAPRRSSRLHGRSRRCRRDGSHRWIRRPGAERARLRRRRVTTATMPGCIGRRSSARSPRPRRRSTMRLRARSS